jgi:putative hydrolase of the HAD superfamily
LLRLPLRRGVLTSSHSEHAERVLNAMQLRDVFEHVIDIRAVNFINKPHRGAYETALARFGVHASETIFVEDTDVNTRPAKAMGMTTILIDHPPTNGADFVVPDLMAAGQVVQQLLDYSTRDNNANTGANTGANT